MAFPPLLESWYCDPDFEPADWGCCVAIAQENPLRTRSTRVVSLACALLALSLTLHAGSKSPRITLESICPDVDADGFADCTAGGCDSTGLQCGDCRDSDPAIHPGAEDTCDHQDNDCDGVVDQNDPAIADSRALIRSGDGPGAGFGTAVAAIGDVTGDGVSDLAIGDSHAEPGVRIGSVTLVSGADGTEVCRTSSGRRGIAVTGIGDVTGDGVPDFAAGIPEAVEGVTVVPGGYRGGIEVYSGADCSQVCRGLDHVQIVEWNSILILDNGYRALGLTIAGVADFDGDGIRDILAGDESGRDTANGGPNLVQGRAALFSGDDCHLIARFIGTTDRERFGHALTDTPDVDGDGLPDLAIGAPGSHPGGGLGAIHLFSGTTFERLRILLPSAALEGGTTLVAVGDLDGDGVADLATGTPGNAISRPSFSGAVMLVSGATGAVLRTCTDPAGAEFDRLGLALASPGDIDHDGTPDLAAAAPFRDTSRGTDAGQIVTFSGADCTVLQRADDPAAQANDRLGLAQWSSLSFGVLAAAPGLGFDVQGAIIVGSPQADVAGAVDRGKALLIGLQSDCDGDGATPFGGDCDDQDPSRHPGVVDLCDGIDNDCDTLIDESADGDPAGVCTDCNDFNPGIYPGAPELCDGLDNDCDGSADEGPDSDGDTFMAPCDCRDDDPAIRPGAPELCNQVDDDCDGLVDDGPDADGDGAQVPCDCNDASPQIRPGMREMCNDIDDDCDGLLDDEVAPYATAARITDPIGAAGDRFGAAVAGVGDVDGDGVSDYAVSAQFDQIPGSSSRGSVILYSGRTKVQICRITDPASAGNMASLAAPGDLTGDGIPDLVIGEPWHVVTLATGQRGAVAIVSGATCAVVRQCIDPEPIQNLQVGIVVDTIPDLSGDGVVDLLAGTKGGEAEIISGADCTVLRRLRAFTPNDIGFGTTLAALGDIDSDGHADIAVGAPTDPHAGGGSGRVYLFSGFSGGILGTLEDTQVNFGSAIAGTEDLDGDGKPDLAAAGSEGTPVLFSSSTRAKLRACDTLTGTCALDGTSDLDHDGTRDLVAGRCGASPAPGFSSAGVISIFSPVDCSVFATSSDQAPVSSARLGESIADLGDLDGDGRTEILAGAPRQDTSAGADAGIAVLFGREAVCQDPCHGVVCDDGDECTIDTCNAGSCSSSAPDENENGMADCIDPSVVDIVAVMGAKRNRLSTTITWRSLSEFDTPAFDVIAVDSHGRVELLNSAPIACRSCGLPTGSTYSLSVSKLRPGRSVFVVRNSSAGSARYGPALIERGISPQGGSPPSREAN